MSLGNLVVSELEFGEMERHALFSRYNAFLISYECAFWIRLERVDGHWHEKQQKYDFDKKLKFTISVYEHCNVHIHSWRLYFVIIFILNYNY